MRMNALFLAALIGCGDKDDTTDTETDADGDGFVAADDCDDDNAAVNPDASETCDGLDTNCDGVVDNAVDGLSTFYRDADADGYGNALSSKDACDAPSGYVADDTDCNDGDDASYPGADEVCDYLDNDCNGSVDDNATDADTWYTDSDQDGYGDDKTGVVSCSEIGGAVNAGGDCDDADRDVNPGEDELCDTIDNNCDGEVDEDGAADGTVYYTDSDGDGYGDPATGIASCSSGKGGVTNGFDCDDTNDTVSPVAEEICDYLDNNCDKSVDEGVTEIFYADSDGDGYGVADGKSELEDCEAPTGYTAVDGDCDDSDDSVNPGAIDFFNDGIIPDCDKTDGDNMLIEDVGISVEATATSLTGHSVSVCDIDGDLQYDIVVARPFDGTGGTYAGGALVYYGVNYTSWTTGMADKEADVVIDVSGQFEGFGLACGDFNGDGFDDVAIGRGEINYSTTYQTDFEILIFEGDAKGWSSSLSESDAMGSVVYDMGAPDLTPTVYDPPFWAGDTDGDGYAELIVDANDQNGDFANADGDLWVLDVSSLGLLEEDMDDYVVASITPDTENAVSSFAVTDDYDGDSSPDIMIGQNGFYNEDDEITSGLFSWLPGVGTDTIADLEAASLEGGEDLGAFGSDFAIGDFDGDGNEDLIVTAYGMDGATLEDVGGLYAYSDFTSVMSSSNMDGVSNADMYTEGVTESGGFGSRVIAMDDFDIDGAEELLVLSRAYGGMLYAVSGNAAMSTGGTIDDVKMLAWEGPSDEILGFDIDTGDIDGDGYDDIVISGINYSSGSTYYYGSVWVVLSSSLGL